MAGHGGARPGAGRKATGRTKKSYTITLPIEVGLDLEKQAEQCNKKVHCYIRDLIIEAGHYNIESLDELKVNSYDEKNPAYSMESFSDPALAADNIKPYKRKK